MITHRYMFLGMNLSALIKIDFEYELNNTSVNILKNC